MLPVVSGKLLEIRAVWRVVYPGRVVDGRTEETLRQGMDIFYSLCPGIFSIFSSISTPTFIHSSLFPWRLTCMALFSDFLSGLIKLRHWGDQRAGRNWSESIYNYWFSPCWASDWQWVYPYTDFSLFLKAIYIYKLHLQTFLETVFSPSLFRLSFVNISPTVASPRVIHYPLVSLNITYFFENSAFAEVSSIALYKCSLLCLLGHRLILP